MTSRSILLTVGAILLVAGLAGAFLLDSRGPEPALECVEEGAPFSGYRDDQQGDCPVSDESYETWNAWQRQSNTFAGIGFSLAAIGVLTMIAGVVIRPRKSPSPEGTHQP